MKKRLISALLCLALCITAIPLSAGATFTDIDDPDVEVAAAVLEGLGIVSGYDNKFTPNSSLTRAELCKIVINAMGLESQVSTYSRKTLFSDVSASSWYNGYVNLAVNQGIMNGYGDGTFGPDDPATYAQVATVILRILGYTSSDVGSMWPMDYTNFAEDLGLADGFDLGDNATITRGQTAIMFYRMLSETVNGSSNSYYKTMSGVSSTEDVILLSVDATYSSNTGLAMICSLESGDVTYYSQSNAQSDVLEGYTGTLLFDSSGKVMGFIPDEGSTLDLTISSATASTLTASDGTSYRISTGAKVISSGDVYTYSTNGYIQVSAAAGKRVRIYYDSDGYISYLYISGGTTTSTTETAVATTTSAESSLARALGITGLSYSITKNGVEAESGDLAMYDVGYYDSASGTLCVSDYKVTGYISSASPSLTAAETITVAGHTFDVLECAWDTLSDFSLGDRVTLLLTDDCKVAAFYSSSDVSAEMIGVLSSDGSSVTLCDSGITLSPSTLNADDDLCGTLVQLKVSSASLMYCTAISETSAKVTIADGTVGDYELAPSVKIYEWVGEGYVYDLDGNQGSASTDLSSITWRTTIPATKVSYYHVNSAGQVDVLLLNDVTGNCYTYGDLDIYTGSDGISIGSSTYSKAGTITNSDGVSSKFLLSGTSTSEYVGIALEKYSSSYEKSAAIMTLKSVKNVTSDDFFLESEQYHVIAGDDEFLISDNVQIYLKETDVWLSGESGLLSIIADNYDMTVYYDANGSNQIRIIVAK